MKSAKRLEPGAQKRIARSSKKKGARQRVNGCRVTHQRFASAFTLQKTRDVGRVCRRLARGRDFFDNQLFHATEFSAGSRNGGVAVLVAPAQHEATPQMMVEFASKSQHALPNMTTKVALIRTDNPHVHAILFRDSCQPMVNDGVVYASRVYVNHNNNLSVASVPIFVLTGRVTGDKPKPASSIGLDEEHLGLLQYETAKLLKIQEMLRL